MARPTVSVIIPVYNRQNLISESILSALSSDYDNFEVIVTDNCSTDNTYEICVSLAAKHPCLRVFQNHTNLGPVENWRRAAQHATGEYLKILFSDDLTDPSFIGRAMNLFEAGVDVGMVFSNVNLLTPSGLRTSNYFWQPKTDIYSSENFIRDFFGGRSLPFSPGCAIFRRQDFLACLHTSFTHSKLTDFAAHGAGPDVCTLLGCSHKHQHIGYILEPLNTFRSHPDSITVQRAEMVQRASQSASFSWAMENLGEAFTQVALTLCYRHYKTLNQRDFMEWFWLDTDTLPLPSRWQAFLMPKFWLRSQLAKLYT